MSQPVTTGEPFKERSFFMSVLIVPPASQRRILETRLPEMRPHGYERENGLPSGRCRYTYTFGLKAFAQQQLFPP